MAYIDSLPDDCCVVLPGLCMADHRKQNDTLLLVLIASKGFGQHEVYSQDFQPPKTLMHFTGHDLLTMSTAFRTSERFCLINDSEMNVAAFFGLP